MKKGKLVPWLIRHQQEFTSIPNKNDVIGCTFFQIDVTSRREATVILDAHKIVVDKCTESLSYLEVCKIYDNLLRFFLFFFFLKK